MKIKKNGRGPIIENEPMGGFGPYCSSKVVVRCWQLPIDGLSLKNITQLAHRVEQVTAVGLEGLDPTTLD